jgi:hypothetical protein
LMEMRRTKAACRCIIEYQLFYLHADLVETQRMRLVRVQNLISIGDQNGQVKVVKSDIRCGNTIDTVLTVNKFCNRVLRSASSM